MPTALSTARPRRWHRRTQSACGSRRLPVEGVNIERQSWGENSYLRVARIEPDTDADGRHRYGSGPFCRFSLRGLPIDAGVYVLTVDRTPVYVGECQNLAQRWGLGGYGSIQPRNCFPGGQQTNCRINNLVLLVAEAESVVELWFRESDQRHAEETVLMQRLRPAWNAQLAR